MSNRTTIKTIVDGYIEDQTRLMWYDEPEQYSTEDRTDFMNTARRLRRELRDKFEGQNPEQNSIRTQLEALIERQGKMLDDLEATLNKAKPDDPD